MDMLAASMDLYDSTPGNPGSLSVPYKDSRRNLSIQMPSLSQQPFLLLGCSHLPPMLKFTVHVCLLQCLFHMTQSQEADSNLLPLVA